MGRLARLRTGSACSDSFGHTPALVVSLSKHDDNTGVGGARPVRDPEKGDGWFIQLGEGFPGGGTQGKVRLTSEGLVGALVAAVIVSSAVGQLVSERLRVPGAGVIVGIPLALL